MKSLTRHLVGGAVLGLLLFGGATVGHADTIVFDRFDGTALNASLWAPTFMDMPAGDGIVSQVNQRLEVTILASSPAHTGAFAGAFLLGPLPETSMSASATSCSRLCPLSAPSGEDFACVERLPIGGTELRWP